MKYSIFSILFFISLSLIIPFESSHAQITKGSFVLAQSGQSLNSAVQSVKQKTGGRILSAKTVNKNGKRIHKIKVLLPSGKVQVFHISAN